MKVFFKENLLDAPIGKTIDEIHIECQKRAAHMFIHMFMNFKCAKYSKWSSLNLFIEKTNSYLSDQVNYADFFSYLRLVRQIQTYNMLLMSIRQWHSCVIISQKLEINVQKPWNRLPRSIWEQHLSSWHKQLLKLTWIYLAQYVVNKNSWH